MNLHHITPLRIDLKNEFLQLIDHCYVVAVQMSL